MTPPEPNNDRLMKGIMFAVLIWGIFLAIGVGIFGINAESGAVEYAPNVARGLIVIGCVLAYLLAWQMLLRSRQ